MKYRNFYLRPDELRIPAFQGFPQALTYSQAGEPGPLSMDPSGEGHRMMEGFQRCWMREDQAWITDMSRDKQSWRTARRWRPELGFLTWLCSAADFFLAKCL